MNSSHLRRIQDWPQHAHEARYSVRGLAKTSGVSVRVLQRFFLATMDDTPRRWLKRLRMQRALELLRDGSNVGETANCLGYHDHSHFSREFKKYYGFAPKQCAKTPGQASPKRKLSHLATKLSHSATKR
jgi:AraC-like DNA-binding protein